MANQLLYFGTQTEPASSDLTPDTGCHSLSIASSVESLVGHAPGRSRVAGVLSLFTVIVATFLLKSTGISVAGSRWLSAQRGPQPITSPSIRNATPIAKSLAKMIQKAHRDSSDGSA
jgi:hypothetical protein